MRQHKINHYGCGEWIKPLRFCKQTSKRNLESRSSSTLKKYNVVMSLEAEDITLIDYYDRTVKVQ